MNTAQGIDQLTGLDASFLAMEGPTTVGHVSGVLILDPSTSPEPWTFERFRRHMGSCLPDLPPMLRKLVEVPLGLDRPYWIHAADFDLDYHVRHIAVPGDGGRTAFADLVSRIHARPLDRRKPLWECYVIEGLEDGRAALLTKVHHAAIDGISGQELLATLLDLDPAVAVSEDEFSLPNRAVVQPDAVMRRAFFSLAMSPLRVAKASITLGRSLPGVGRLLAGVSAAGSGSGAGRVHLTAPKTPFNAAIGPHRRWAYSSVSLDEIKAVKNAAGVTVNDVVLALVGGVLRRWLADNGGIPERPLVAMVPLSVRQPGQEHAIGNHVSSTLATLATDLDDPVERLAVVHDGMVLAKEQHETLPANMLTDITQVAPPAVSALAARLVASTRLADRVAPPFNVVVSNVPGPPVPLYLAGAQLLGNFPVSAIVDGVGLNITVMSTNGLLDFGFVSDRDLIPDLWAMADLLPAELAELADAVG